MAGYEARVGNDKVLELLRSRGQATFFVAGWTVEAHPHGGGDLARRARDRPSRLLPLMPEPGDPAIQDELDRGFRDLEAAGSA
jgi:peptidoglycan/xylan/chitin deacetylase (PgdA/CDA1 family)